MFRVYAIRYMGASLDAAGLVLGAITIIGGLGGTILGSKVAEIFRPKIKNAYFLVPALFILLGAVFLLLAINATESFAVSSIFALLTQISVWTYTGPISAISITTVPSRVSLCLLCSILGSG